jgi:hypothetical protein
MKEKKNSKKSCKKNMVPTNVTLGLADVEKVDKDCNATRPSDASVQQTKDWSEENKQ